MSSKKSNEATIRLAGEDSEYPIITVGERRLAETDKKRREEAEKPLYLERI